MTYKDTLKKTMNELARSRLTRFIGYNVSYGPRMHGTLVDVPLDRCIELPVAENLMVGIAMGLALEGFRPIVCFERMDFMLVAADAIINHVDKLPYLSGDQFHFPIIFRCVVGTDAPLDPGVQHTQDHSTLFHIACKHMRVVRVCTSEDIEREYARAARDTDPTMIVEYKQWYNDVI